MTDSKGPYRVHTIKQSGPADKPYSVGIPGVSQLESFRLYPDAVIACHVANLAHHTARREAIEACVKVVHARCIELVDNGQEAHELHMMTHRLRALLGAGEKEESK